MNTQINFPLFLPGRNSEKNNKISVLAADIGGTKTNVGWFESENGMMVLKEEATYSSKTHQSFSHIIQKFIREYNLEKPDRISIGVAGPVLNGKCITTNLPWSLDIGQIKNEAYKINSSDIKIWKKNGNVLDFTEASDIDNIAYRSDIVIKYYITYPRT